jgi:uncharacterized membrane protein
MNNGNVPVAASRVYASGRASDGVSATTTSRRDLALLAGVVAACTCLYALVGVVNHRHFGSSLDVAIFDQAVWHLSRWERPFSSIKGYNIFGDHFHPIIVLFVPGYWIAPGPASLIVTQAIAFGASIVPVFLYMRRRFPSGPALGLAVAYGLFWGLQRAALFDVHEVAFAPFSVALAILALDRRDWLTLWIAALLLIVTKEDLIPLVTFLGLYVFVFADRRQGAALTTVSLLTFFAVLRIVIPWFSGLGYYPYTGTYGDVLARPWRLLVTLVTPVGKLRTVFLWLAPFLFLPLLSPVSVLLIPLALERLLSEAPGHWGTSFHYTAPLAPILAMGAADGLARLLARLHSPARAHRALVWTVAAMIVLSAFLPGRQPMWRLFSPARYAASPAERSAPAAFARIPASASVVAPAAIAAHLSQRDGIHILEPGGADADFVIVSAEVDPWPAASHEALQMLLDERRARGYQTVYDADGWTILRRPPAGGHAP